MTTFLPSLFMREWDNLTPFLGETSLAKYGAEAAVVAHNINSRKKPLSR